LYRQALCHACGRGFEKIATRWGAKSGEVVLHHSVVMCARCENVVHRACCPWGDNICQACNIQGGTLPGESYQRPAVPDNAKVSCRGFSRPWSVHQYACPSDNASVFQEGLVRAKELTAAVAPYLQSLLDDHSTLQAAADFVLGVANFGITLEQTMTALFPEVSDPEIIDDLIQVTSSTC